MLGDLIFLTVAAAMPVVLAAAFVRCRRHRIAHAGRRPFLHLLAGNVLMLATLASVGLLAAECYYRFWYDTTDSFGLTRTTSRWFKRYYALNRMGFRDNVEYAHTRPPGRRRVSFLGDSFTAGHGVKDVNDRFVNRLRAAHPEWDVEALAVNGADTGDEIKLMQHLGEDHHDLDQVVLVACLNDIADIVPEWQAIARRVYQRAQHPGFLITHSYCINTLYFRFVAALEPDVRRYYGSLRAAYDGPIWATQRDRIVLLRQMCHAQGAQLMMVLFPFLHELGPDYGYRAVHEQIAALCAAQHIPLLDLLALFEQHESEDLVVNRHDAHPNERAHGMAASAIDAFLARAMTGDVAGPVNELYLRGLALTRAGSKDAAAACLTQALRLFPDHADSHSLLGLLALQGGEGDRALQHFRAAAELCPWSASEQNNVGLAWARLGDADAALAAYTRALVLEPEFPEAHANAARTLEQLGADDAADRHYREALRLDAGDAETHADFGRLLARQRHDREASQHLRESLRLKPDGVAAATRLAWLLATSEDASVRDPALSLQWAERAVSATQQREPAPLDALAAALAEAGRFAEAAVAAEQALALARSTHAATLAADIEKRLQSYRSQRRAREQS